MFSKEELMGLPVKSFFLNNGFKVRSEVLSFDLVCEKSNIINIVELKLKFNLKLIQQAANALTYAECVYIAIPDIYKSKDLYMIKDICRGLGIGLLIVNPDNVHNPIKPRKSVVIRKPAEGRLLKEFNGRPLDENIAGTTGIKQMTRYKYLSLSVVDILYNSPNHEIKVSELKKILSKNEKEIYGILYNNYYKYFIKKGGGIYQLSTIGIEEYQNRNINIKSIKELN